MSTGDKSGNALAKSIACLRFDDPSVAKAMAKEFDKTYYDPQHLIRCTYIGLESDSAAPNSGEITGEVKELEQVSPETELPETTLEMENGEAEVAATVVEEPEPLQVLPEKKFSGPVAEKREENDDHEEEPKAIENVSSLTRFSRYITSSMRPRETRQEKDTSVLEGDRAVGPKRAEGTAEGNADEKASSKTTDIAPEKEDDSQISQEERK